MKANRKQVEAAAKKAGFILEIDGDSVFIAAPKGHAFENDSYGHHYSEWPVGRNEEYTKAYAYDRCMEIIADGFVVCDCGNCT